jgi:glycosyltransferase involved in cell wall biosynthesis
LKSYEVINLEPPRIDAVPDGVPRPFWSVMIPTYNCAKYLRQTLESVLAQDSGPDQMQIEVVDDCSTEDDPQAVIQEIGQGRIRFYRQPQNQGLVQNFNTSIARSRGHLIHILHGDDYVLAEFYSKMGDVAKRHQDIALFYSRALIVDEQGETESMSDRIRELEKPTNAVGSLLYANPFRTPGIVVRRACYEQVGGFRSELSHVADWEMWVRAIRHGQGLSINESLAAYRAFDENDTSKRTRAAENLEDIRKLNSVFANHYSEFKPYLAQRRVSELAFQQSEYFLKTGNKDAAAASFRFWRKVTPWRRRVRKQFGNLVRVVFR